MLNQTNDDKDLIEKALLQSKNETEE